MTLSSNNPQLDMLVKAEVERAQRAIAERLATYPGVQALMEKPVDMEAGLGNQLGLYRDAVK